MNKLKLFLISLILLFVAAGCQVEQSSPSTTSGEGAAEGEEKIVLRASTGLPEHHIWMTSYLVPWMEKVEKDTNGKVEFELFAGGELVALGQEFDALNAGTIDLALPIMPLYDPSRFPLSEVTMLPLADTNMETFNKAYADLIYGDYQFEDGQTFSETEFTANKLKVWAMNGGTPYVLSTTGTNVDTIEDIQGLRIRTGSRLNELYVKNLGATPISMPQTDAYDALSRGTIDGTLMSVGDWAGWGYQELFKYVLEGAYTGHFSAVFGMLEEKWNSLPADVQEVLENSAKELQLGPEQHEAMSAEEKKVLDEVQGKVEFETLEDLDPATRDHIMAAMEKTWFDWIELMEAGGQPGKETAILWRDIITENGGKVPDAVNELK